MTNPEPNLSPRAGRVLRGALLLIAVVGFAGAW